MNTYNTFAYSIERVPDFELYRQQEHYHQWLLENFRPAITSWAVKVFHWEMTAGQKLIEKTRSGYNTKFSVLAWLTQTKKNHKIEEKEYPSDLLYLRREYLMLQERTWSEYWASWGDYLSDTFGDIAQSFQKALDISIDKIENYGAYFKSLAVWFEKKLKESLAAIYNKAKELIDYIMNNKVAQDATKLITGLIKCLWLLANKASEKLDQIFSPIWDFINKQFENFVTALKKIFDKILDATICPVINFLSGGKGGNLANLNPISNWGKEQAKKLEDTIFGHPVAKQIEGVIISGALIYGFTKASCFGFDFVANFDFTGYFSFALDAQNMSLVDYVTSVDGAAYLSTLFIGLYTGGQDIGKGLLGVTGGFSVITGLIMGTALTLWEKGVKANNLAIAKQSLKASDGKIDDDAAQKLADKMNQESPNLKLKSLIQSLTIIGTSIKIINYVLDYNCKPT